MKSDDYLDFGLRVLDKTRLYIRERIEEGFENKRKDDGTFVTSVDTGVEKILRDAIGKEYPDHGIIGEENGASNQDAEFIWYVDPIDGTAEFVEGKREYGTLLSLYYNGSPIVGFIDHPSLDIRLYARKGGGAYMNGQRITITDTDELSATKKRIAIGPRFMFAKQGMEADFDALVSKFSDFDEIQNCHWHTRLLSNEFDVAVDYGLRSWDISPVRILVEESGGKFIEVSKQIIDKKDRHAIIFGKPGAVDYIIECLNKT